MPVNGPNLDIASSCLWDFPLIANINGENRCYYPKSDLSLRVKDFPHLVLEIISTPSEADRYRMLLQAACLARAGNALRPDRRADPFIASAIYINAELVATWHFVFQPNVSKTGVRLILRGALTTYVSAG
jgi:hypothetical protein